VVLLPTVSLTEAEAHIINKLRGIMKFTKGHLRIDWNEGELSVEENKKEKIEPLKLNTPN